MAAIKRNHRQAGVEDNLTPQWQAFCTNHAEQTNSAGGNREAEQSSAQSEQSCFNQHFTDDVFPARPQSLPHCVFLGATTGTHQKKIS